MTRALPPEEWTTAPPPQPGVLGHAYLDNSALPDLRSLEKRQELWARLDALGLTLMLTELNVMQALAAGPRRGRELLEILVGVARSPWILPAPDRLLRDVITQVTAGERGSITDIIALNHPDQIADLAQECIKAKSWCASADAAYADYLRSHQQTIRDGLRKRFVRPTLDQLPAFVATWPSMQWYDELRGYLWKRLGFEGDAPHQLELHAAPLRVEMAAPGVGLFEHAIAYDVGKPTERTDLLQLCYLGMHNYSLLITNDHGQLRAANVVLPLSGLQGYGIKLADLLTIDFG